MNDIDRQLGHLSPEERKLLGERLRLAREEAGLTQKGLAARLGLTQATISRFETGERGVEVAELVVLARLYRKKPTWFLEPPERSDRS